MSLKVEKVEIKQARNGKDYQFLTLEGKNYNYFGKIKLKVGDIVDCIFTREGEYTNIKSLKIVDEERPADVGVKVVDEETAVWENLKKGATEEIKRLKQGILLNEGFIELAEQKLKK